MKQNIKEIFQKKKKKKNEECLRKLVKVLNNIEKYGPCNRHDFDYNGIADIPILFGQTSEEDYCKPIFVKSSHEGNYKYY